MKKKDLTSLREKKVEDLKKLVEEKKSELRKTQTELASKKEKNLKKVKNLKIEIAQVLTLIREGQLIVKKEQI